VSGLCSKRAGVGPSGPHRLRRTFALRCKRDGVDLHSLRMFGCSWAIARWPWCSAIWHWVHAKFVSERARGVAAAKDDKDDSIMTPIKEAKKDQWWGSSLSEYVVDTTITNDMN